MNNLRRVYTDGRDHPPAADAFPTPYGDSIGFWAGHTLVIHTSQVAAGIFHRNDPKYSEQLDAVEVWNKVDPDTVVVDVWAYDPETLARAVVRAPDVQARVESRRLPAHRLLVLRREPEQQGHPDRQGTSQFADFTFTKQGDKKK